MRNLIKSLVVLFALFPITSFASLIDPCDQLKGEWKGTVTVKHTLYTCQYNAQSVIYKVIPNGDLFEMQTYMTAATHHFFCAPRMKRRTTITGTCMNGELWFKQMTYHGKVTVNHFDMQSNIYHTHQPHFNMSKVV